jgi:hypothetical protein
MRIKMFFSMAVWVFGVSIAIAQSPYPEQRPLDLRVTGAFLPDDQQKKRDDIVTVDVSVQGKPMLLRVGKVEDLTTQERAQAVKGEVLLRKVHFTGPEELMARLQKPEMVGKVVTLEGWLDTQSRRFQITTVKEMTEAAPATKGH